MKKKIMFTLESHKVAKIKMHFGSVKNFVEQSFAYEKKIRNLQKIEIPKYKLSSLNAGIIKHAVRKDFFDFVSRPKGGSKIRSIGMLQKKGVTVKSLLGLSPENFLFEQAWEMWKTQGLNVDYWIPDTFCKHDRYLKYVNLFARAMRRN